MTTPDDSTIVAWTGHRPDLFADPGQARRTVLAEAKRVRDELTGPLRFRVGGQRGVDMWAALAGQDLRIPYDMVLPLPVEEFTAGWSADEKATFEFVAHGAAITEIVGGVEDEAYQERNRRLVTGAGLVVAVWTNTQGGGTAETVLFGQLLGVPVREVLLPRSTETVSPRGRGV